VGVLSALAIVGYRKYVHSAQSSEAKTMIEAIRGAEEVYKSEMLQYLGSSTEYYPNPTPNDLQFGWVQTNHPDYPTVWQILNVQADSAVRFGYWVAAGTGTGAALKVPDTSTFTTAPALPSVAKGVPWYVVEAKNSHWADSRYVAYVSTSVGSEIAVDAETN